ncbi:hypothetical protein EDB89DRAFT_2085211 [Lactarius sanguifluus]|nr:hypothetical protein EDB89DRAFT_2085211 [Lactarius sanguifluus]
MHRMSTVLIRPARPTPTPSLNTKHFLITSPSSWSGRNDETIFLQPSHALAHLRRANRVPVLPIQADPRMALTPLDKINFETLRAPLDIRLSAPSPVPSPTPLV